MKYLPFENITYQSKYNTQQILEKVEDILEPKKVFRITGMLGSDHKPYEGFVSGNSFKMSRIINYQNSFLPTVTGFVEKDYNGTAKINVKMRLHFFVILFLCVWFGGVGIGVLAALSSQEFSAFSVIPFLMLFFGYALTTGAFKYESLKTKKYLADLFKAEVRAE